jgi:hypothetical protein
VVGRLFKKLIKNIFMRQNWTNAILYKPDVNDVDEFEKMQERSERVLVWVEGDSCARFAVYVHSIEKWFIEGYLGFDQKKVKYFQYISNPY